MKYCLLAIPMLAMLLLGCTPKERSVRVEAGNMVVASTARGDGAERVRAVLERVREAVDSIRRPVLGEAALPLEKYIPESPLMNFAADALLEMAQRYSSSPVDIAITNKGGLRSNIAAGTVTFGDIYNVFPFENTLAFLTLDGKQLRQLCCEIASVGGEAVSGMRMVITEDGGLVDVTVGGEPLNDPSRKYRVATSDYLAQGNDKMITLSLGTERNVTNIIIRDLMVQYVKELTASGKMLGAVCDGRITVKKP